MKKLIKFEREGCAPCKMVQMFLDSEGIEVLNFDPLVSEDMATKFDVTSVPVLILLGNDDKELKRCIGFNLSQLKDIVEEFKI